MKIIAERVNGSGWPILILQAEGRDDWSELQELASRLYYIADSMIPSCYVDSLERLDLRTLQLEIPVHCYGRDPVERSR